MLSLCKRIRSTIIHNFLNVLLLLFFPLRAMFIMKCYHWWILHRKLRRSAKIQQKTLFRRHSIVNFILFFLFFDIGKHCRNANVCLHYINYSHDILHFSTHISTFISIDFRHFYRLILISSFIVELCPFIWWVGGACFIYIYIFLFLFLSCFVDFPRFLFYISQIISDGNRLQWQCEVIVQSDVKFHLFSTAYWYANIGTTTLLTEPRTFETHKEIK